MFSKKILAHTLGLIFILSACSSKTSNRYREADNKGQKVDMSVEDEKKLTKEALGQMQKEYPQVKDQKLQIYIENLGQKIVRANNLHHNPYTYNFTTVDVTNVNAFALPAGSIFITTSIIAMAQSEAEVAGVIGHEIAHVTARHTAERMYVAKKEQNKTWLYGGVGAVLGGTVGLIVGKKLCKADDMACKTKMAAYGAAGGGGAGLLIHKYGFMENSREDELEADRAGFKYAVNAGYDKMKVGDFYGRLLALEKSAKKDNNALMARIMDAMSTHPPSQERVDQSKEMQSKILSEGGISSGPEFSQMKILAQTALDEAKKREAAQPQR